MPATTAAVQPAVDLDALLAEGQAAERAGRRAEARGIYERALADHEAIGDGKRTSGILRWIARTYVGDGRMEDALEVLARAVDRAEAHGDASAIGHATNVKAVIHWQQGAVDEAERLYLLARTHALRAGDAKLAAMTSQNLGVIANVRGDSDEARRHYEASLSEYRSLGLPKDVGVALNNLGLLHIQTENWDSAERAFSEAVQVADAIGDVSARILLDVNLGEMWVARRDFAKAQHVVRHALDLAARSGDGACFGQAAKLLGIIAREVGDPVEADAQLQQAEAIAAARSDVLLEAEVMREAGELARRQGRNARVLQCLNRAHRLFTQLRARRDLVDIDSRTGRLEDDFLQVARRWGESIEAKDRYTQGHCVRVADLACAMASELGFPEQDLFWFRIGALLHDVGKIVIPEAVLNKPGRLTDEEWVLMKSHTTAGVDMLADIQFPWDVLPVIRSHHERWDGAGYPQGLKGEEIPLVARILCVADVYDALTSVRSYKAGMTHARAMELMRKDVGTMFDPTVFGVFEGIAEEWAARPGTAEAAARSAADAASTLAVEPAAAGDTPTETVVEATPGFERDDLTRLPMRREFREAAERLLAARQTSDRQVSLLVIDVDHFKLVNDSFGHLQGDDVLRMVAELLAGQTRPSDFVARYAGDEFVVLLPGSPLEQAMEIAERLRHTVEGMPCPRRNGGEPVFVSLSIGVATAPMHGETLDELFAAADGALYEVKRRRRNAVRAASGATASEPTLLVDTFVGRSTERRRLSTLLDGASRGFPAVVSVVGEAGVGKSTLLRQLAPEVAMRAGALIVGRCADASIRPPYGPWRDVVQALHAMGAVTDRTWRALPRLVPALGDEQLAADGPDARIALVQELEAFLRAATLTRTLVIVLDDMQWADGETWDVLEYLAPRLGSERLLLALTVRVEELQDHGLARLRGLSRHASFSELELRRLGRPDLEQWLRVALGGQTPDPVLAELLHTRTEGNPLFAVQTLRALAEDRSLRYEEGRWHFHPSADAVLPTAVRDLLARRVDRLGERTRHLLGVAAVLGTRFETELLPEASDASLEEVEEAIDEGVQTKVLAMPADGAASVFAFTHGLLAEVLRRTLSPMRRRRAHQRIGQLLAARGHVDPSDVARHFHAAGNRTETLRHAVLAGQRAMHAYAYDAARGGFDMAAGHARSVDEHADVQWRLAQLDERTDRYREAESRCDALLSTWAAGTHTLALEGRVRRLRARLWLLRGVSATDVLVEVEALLTDARRTHDAPEAVALLLLSSSLRARLGEHSTAESLARAALQEAEGLGDAALTADVLVRLGSTLLPSSPADAIACWRQALDAFTRIGDRRGQLRCQINIGVACDRLGTPPAAEQAYSTALGIGRDLGAADLTALASMNLGALLAKTGRHDEARLRFVEARTLYESVGNAPHRLSALYNLAHLAREGGDIAGALELYETALGLADQLGQIDVQVGSHGGIGLAELARGRTHVATSHLRVAEQVMASRSDAWFQGRELAEALAVRLLASHGDRGAARERLEAALPIAEAAERFAAVWLVAQCADVLDGEDEGSRELLQRYLMLARALAYEPLVARLVAARSVSTVARAA